MDTEYEDIPWDLEDIDEELGDTHKAKPNPEHTQSLLDHLAIARADFEELTIAKDKALSAAMPEEVRMRLNAIEADFDAKFQSLATQMQSLEQQITISVISNKESIKGRSGLQGVWFPGKISWDSKGLMKLAGKVKAILDYRKEGEPYVQIRRY